MIRAGRVPTTFSMMRPWKNALTRDEQRVLRAAWSLPEAAAFEFGHLLVNQAPPQVAAIQLGWTPDDIENTLASAMGKLSALRDGRSLPVDDKALAGWNALALEAFVEGAIQSDKADYAHAARQIKRYIQTTLWQDDRLLRARARGSALGTVSLADYAYTARALLASATGPGRRMISCLRTAWRKLHGGIFIGPTAGSARPTRCLKAANCMKCFATRRCRQRMRC